MPNDPARSGRARGLRAVRAACVAALVGACAGAGLSGTAEDAPDRTTGGAAARPVRVALAPTPDGGTVGADSPWQLLAGDGSAVLAEPAGGRSYRVAPSGRALVAAPVGGGPGPAPSAVMVVRPASRSGLVRWNGRRYRGELVLSVVDGGLRVVNRVPLEDYLRGVVPREVGSLAARDMAAVEAQAVASRTYALAHLGPPGDARSYDLTAGVSSQVYGGVDAERPASDAAVAATSGQVLLMGGRLVDAPYHSTCGGSTAAPGEVWRGPPSPPHLRPVSDRIPGTDRAYCDISPRYRWRRTFERSALEASLARYLGAHAAVPAGGPGAVRSVRVASRTPSDRVGALAIATDRGEYALRGNQIRSVLRTVGGEILHSTYFTVDTVVVGVDGRVARLTLRGGGNGHGVGMCQWGAVGRARAGHDYRAILRAYYPGTTVGSLGVPDAR